MFQKLFKRNDDPRNAEIIAEIAVIRSVLVIYEQDCLPPDDIITLSEIRTWYISRLKHIPEIIEWENQERKTHSVDVYKLKAEIRDKDKEIETLKMLLEWSKEDEQEWKDHKGIFNFMVKKYKVLNNKCP